MGYLNVEDFRFDMISEIDYNHRLMAANIRVTSGSKTLNFRSYDKERLRKLIGHVQHCMAENKKKQSSDAQTQHQHLEQINQQLQAYLVAQHKQQQKLQDHLMEMQNDKTDDVKPIEFDEADMSPQLKDYLYAKGLMDAYKQATGQDPVAEKPAETTESEPDTLSLPAPEKPAMLTAHAGSSSNQLDEIYAEGLQEVYGSRLENSNSSTEADQTVSQPVAQPTDSRSNNHLSPLLNVFEVNPLKIAYRWLPQALRSRKFGLSMPSISTPTFPSFTTSPPSKSQSVTATAVSIRH
jgi:hypothetical protein